MAELEPLPTYTVRVHRLDATLAELHIEFAGLPEDVDVRGRLMGPRCPGVSTIEVAYYLRPERGSRSIYSVRIPEPVCWSADRPCTYEGPVEFWRNGQPAGVIRISLGIRNATG
jgi:hypothetical protein